MAKSTVTALFVVPVRQTVRTMLPSPSATELVLLLKRRTAESLVLMVTVSVRLELARAVFVGVRRRTEKASRFSATRSFSTVTEKVLLVSPAAKESRPFVAM